MALWAFHNNPGIGGFGESNRVHFDDIRIHTSKQIRGRERKKRRKESFLSNYENEAPKGVSKICDNDHDVGNTACDLFDEHSIGEGDLICQIVKELVDNAVDACRRPNYELDNLDHTDQKKRIRVEIRPPTTGGPLVCNYRVPNSSKKHSDDILQVIVTDTGCGMENIQNCVDAFQSSKSGGEITRNFHSNTSNNDNNNHSSGRYGIGLTLSLLHAQRCVPNSRAWISSATPKSRFQTRALFEVDKHDDSVKCVQEEILNLSTFGQSGTCVSLLVPGGSAAKIAWPRLSDYFTRFRLSTNLHFELDVFAPTLCKLPIYIRPRKSVKFILGTSPTFNQRNCVLETRQNYLDIDEWEDLLDSDDCEEEKNCNLTSLKKRTYNEYPNSKCIRKVDPNRHEFVHAVQSFWPTRKIVYNNVAWSVRNIRNYSNRIVSTKKGKQMQTEIQIEVKMAVCPHLDYEKENISSADSATTRTTPNKVLLGNEKTAILHLVRIVNDVPIMESPEAHSCGLVHGIANKSVWGSFGLDIERSTAVDPDTRSYTPSFLLRDSSLIAPFINRNMNHRQKKTDDYNNSNDHHTHETRKWKMKGGMLSQQDLLPANVRIGTILIVAHVRAALSSLPLPSLSKGRLPFNHQPINSALELALKDCLVSLKSTNPTLFLTTSRLRTVERNVRYIPGISSAISRIIYRSSNQSFLCKSLDFFPMISTSGDKIPQNPLSLIRHIREESSTDEEHENETNGSKYGISFLTDAFESRLRLAIMARSGLMSKKQRMRQKRNRAKNEENDDFDYVREKKMGKDLSQVSIRNKSDSFLLSSSTSNKTPFEATSVSFLHSHSLETLPARDRYKNYSCEESTLHI